MVESDEYGCQNVLGCSANSTGHKSSHSMVGGGSAIICRLERAGSAGSRQVMGLQMADRVPVWTVMGLQVAGGSIVWSVLGLQLADRCGSAILRVDGVGL